MTVTTVNDLPGSLSVSARGVVCGNQGGAIQSIFWAKLSIRTNRSETARRKVRKMARSTIDLWRDATKIMGGATEVLTHHNAVAAQAG